MFEDERSIWEDAQDFVEIHHNIDGAILKKKGFIGNDKDMNRLKSQLKDLKLAQAVDFLPYSPTNGLSVLDEATIFFRSIWNEYARSHEPWGASGFRQRPLFDRPALKKR